MGSLAATVLVLAALVFGATNPQVAEPLPWPYRSSPSPNPTPKLNLKPHPKPNPKPNPEPDPDPNPNPKPNPNPNPSPSPSPNPNASQLVEGVAEKSRAAPCVERVVRGNKITCPAVNE